MNIVSVVCFFLTLWIIAVIAGPLISYVLGRAVRNPVAWALLACLVGFLLTQP
jgi:hypothetical protein